MISPLVTPCSKFAGDIFIAVTTRVLGQLLFVTSYLDTDFYFHHLKSFTVARSSKNNYPLLKISLFIILPCIHRAWEQMSIAGMKGLP